MEQSLNDSKLTNDDGDMNTSLEHTKDSKFQNYRPAFYTAVTRTDVLAFSVPVDLVDRLPHDVFETVRENLT